MPATRHLAKETISPGIAVSIPQIMLFQVAALIGRSLIQVKMIDAGSDPVVAGHVSALAGFAMLALLMWPIMLNAWPSVREQFKCPPSWPRMLLASATLGFVLWLGQMLALLALIPFAWSERGPLTYPTSPSYTFACSNPMILLLAIPVMSLMTPVIEEVINRGIILPQLLPRGRTAAILISAVLFAIVHEFSGIPNAFVLGVVMAIQAIHSRNLWAVTITHGVTNLLIQISITCVHGFWLRGKIAWVAGSPAQIIAVSFVICLIAVWWLTVQYKTGAAPAKNHPDSS